MPEDGTIIVKQHSSMHAIFQRATDPTLKVITHIWVVAESCSENLTIGSHFRELPSLTIEY